MKVVSDEVPYSAAEIVGKLLTIGREYDVTLWMPPEVPRWKERASDQTFAVARWKEDHEPRDFVPLDGFQLFDNQLMMSSQFKRRPLSDRIASQILMGQGERLLRYQISRNH
jgi:hypothetical protein